MDRGRKKFTSDIERSLALRGAAARLSGLACGGDPQGGDATHGGARWRDDRAALSGNAARCGEVRAHAGPESGDCHFRDGGAGTTGALERRRIAPSFGKPLMRSDGLRTEEKRRQAAALQKGFWLTITGPPSRCFS